MTREIQSHTLRCGDTEVTVLSIGCAVQSWTVGGRPVVLGFADPEAYRSATNGMGALCGRVVNRIRNARFTLDGQEWLLATNDGPHQLHGGPEGIGRQVWDLQPDGPQAVHLSLVSPHLDMGYPGEVRFDVTLRLDGRRLSYDMRAVPDRPTPVNLGQHLYFNLNGAGEIRDHRLRIAASRYTPNDAAIIPVGRIDPVDGTKYDFRQPVLLGEADPDRSGWDGNVVLDDGPGPQAEVTAPDGMRLRLWTDQPGLQVYTAQTLSAQAPAGPGALHRPFAGLCLEAQALPDTPNCPQFGSILCTPDAPYRQQTSIEIAPGA